jgi:hypothetical protein
MAKTSARYPWASAFLKSAIDEHLEGLHWRFLQSPSLRRGTGDSSHSFLVSSSDSEE